MTSPDMPDAVTIGHWTASDGSTGCTVVLFPSLTPAVVDVRGGAPGTRETDLLAEGSLVRAVDAIILTGGSAFGLATADGVMRFLRERGRGFPTSSGPVPIVPAAVIFDLQSASSTPPGANEGYLASQNAQPLPVQAAGRYGAGAGATMQKLWGPSLARSAGIGISTLASDHGTVTAVVICNAAGAPIGSPLSPLRQIASRQELLHRSRSMPMRESTTIGAVIVEGVSNRDLLQRCAIAAHDGLARSIVPSHTIYDGDLFFAAGLRDGNPAREAFVSLPVAAELAVEQAIAAIAAL